MKKKEFGKFKTHLFNIFHKHIYISNLGIIFAQTSTKTCFTLIRVVRKLSLYVLSYNYTQFMAKRNVGAGKV